MDLNQTKCGVLHLTRSREPTITDYTVLDTPVNRSSRQRDLGISITSDLKWNTQMQDISSKAANKMLGFMKSVHRDTTKSLTSLKNYVLNTIKI